MMYRAEIYKRKWQFTNVLFLLALMLVHPTQAATYYFHNDHLGTPQVLTDEDQTVVWQGSYDPFGKVDETVALVEQNLRFPGQYLDRESGLHYNYFRDYDPDTGRYVQSDPIGLGGGSNTYQYTNANPIDTYDPYGLYGIDSVYESIYMLSGGWSPSQTTIDTIAGFGDGVSSALTFGQYSTANVRQRLDIDNVDECSSYYQIAGIAGEAWGAATYTAAGLNGGANSVFWSGTGALTDAGRLGTTLEKTPIGRALNLVQDLTGLKIPKAIWDGASAIFALNAKNGARAMIRDTSPTTTWARIEAPILRFRGINTTYLR